MWRVFTTALLVAAPLLSAGAQESRGFYLGADLGQSMLGAEQSELDNSLINAFESVGLTVLDGSSDLRDEDLTYSLTLGYQVLPFLAVEAAWLDLGSFRYKANATVTDGTVVDDANLQFDASAKGPALSALGILPFADVWSVYARVGVLFADVNSSARVESGGLAEKASDSSGSTEMLWGAGLGFTSGSWTTRLDFQRVMDVGDEDDFGESDIDRVTISAIYRYQ